MFAALVAFWLVVVALVAVAIAALSANAARLASIVLAAGSILGPCRWWVSQGGVPMLVPFSHQLVLIALGLSVALPIGWIASGVAIRRRGSDETGMTPRREG